MNRRRSIILAVALVWAAVLATFILYDAERRRQREVSRTDLVQFAREAAEQAEVPAQKLEVTLFLYRPRPDQPGRPILVRKRAEIGASEDLIRVAHQIVTAVLRDSENLVPPQAGVRQVYLLEEDGTMVVDLSRETSDQLVGGVGAEWGLLRSISRSLVENLEAVRQVRFLVDGDDRPTFAGHVSIHSPFM